MKRSVRTAFLCAGLVLAGTPWRLASADRVLPTGFDIEVQELYCLNTALPCNTTATITNSMFIEVQAVSFHPGATSGTPDGVDMTCGTRYIDSNHVAHNHVEHVYASTAQAPLVAGYDRGPITGTAQLGPNPSPSNTQATSAISLTAYDPHWRDTATVSGSMVDNNMTHHLVSGGYTITLQGAIWDEPAKCGTKPVLVGNGIMHCDTMHTPVTAPGVPPPLFVAEIHPPKPTATPTAKPATPTPTPTPTAPPARHNAVRHEAARGRSG
jgi:hypothetical protein